MLVAVPGMGVNPGTLLLSECQIDLIGFVQSDFITGIDAAVVSEHGKLGISVINDDRDSFEQFAVDAKDKSLRPFNDNRRLGHNQLLCQVFERKSQLDFLTRLESPRPIGNPILRRCVTQDFVFDGDEKTECA